MFNSKSVASRLAKLLPHLSQDFPMYPGDIHQPKNWPWPHRIGHTTNYLERDYTHELSRPLKELKVQWDDSSRWPTESIKIGSIPKVPYFDNNPNNISDLGAVAARLLGLSTQFIEPHMDVNLHRWMETIRPGEVIPYFGKYKELLGAMLMQSPDNVKELIMSHLSDGASGLFWHKNKKIELSNNLTLDDLKETLLHEHRHSEQSIGALPVFPPESFEKVNSIYIHKPSIEDIMDRGFTAQEAEYALGYLQILENVVRQKTKKGLHHAFNQITNNPKRLANEFDAELHAKHRLNELNKWLAANQPGKYQTPTGVLDEPYGYLISDFDHAHGMENMRFSYDVPLKGMVSKGLPRTTPSPWDTNIQDV